MSVITEKGETTTSYLLIQRAKKRDSGKYSCTPSNANPYTVNVHILNGNLSTSCYKKEKITFFLNPGETPAAMQHSGDNSSMMMLPSYSILVFVYFCKLFH